MRYNKHLLLVWLFLLFGLTIFISCTYATDSFTLATFKDETQINISTTNDVVPAVDINSTNGIYLMYMKNTLGQGPLGYKISIDEGSSWGSEMILDPIIKGYREISVLINKSNEKEILVGYSDDSIPGINAECWFKKSNDYGKTWSSKIQATPGETSIDNDPSIALVSYNSYIPPYYFLL